MRTPNEVVALYLVFLWATFCFHAGVTAHPSEHQSESFRQAFRQASSPSFQVQIPPSLQNADRDRSIYDRVKSVISTIIGAASFGSRSDSVNSSSLASNISPPNTLLERYGRDVVLRFTFSSAKEVEALAKAFDALYLDVWDFTERWVDVRLSKDVVPSLLGLLPLTLQNSHAPLMHDLAHVIYASYPSPATIDPSAPSSSNQGTFGPSLRPASYDTTNVFFRSYQPLSVIDPWLRLLTSLFPTHVRLFSIGLSYEGRKIPTLRIGVHPTNTERPLGPRKTIIISGGSHAREWISTSTVNYLAYSLITSYGKSKTMTRMLEEFDWVLIPILNPDGYVYTWEIDRLWRKNRQQTAFRFCKGLDLDRSYGFEWDAEASKNNPCSESFSGEEPFEGIEARVFAKWARNETENNNVKFIGFLDFHSYSQRILYPYSYSCTSAPPSLETLEELGLGLAKAMRNSGGETYGVTSACDGSVTQDKSSNRKTADRKNQSNIFPRMETGGGSALDWFYHELKVHYAYQIKLRDTGSYGFLLPSENIIPTGKEAFRAVTYLGWKTIRETNLVEDTGDKLVAAEVGREDSRGAVEDNINRELRQRRRR